MTPVDDEAFNAWADKLSQSSLTLAPPVSAEVLAEEFGRLDADRRDAMCREAVMLAIDDDQTEIALECFQAAYEQTAPEPAPDPEPDDDSVDEPAEAASGPDDLTDEEETQPAAEMSRAELESEVKSLRREVDKLQEVANRDMAVLKGALTNLLDVDDLDELPAAGAQRRQRLTECEQRVDDVENEVESLDGVIADGGGGKAGKVHNIARMAANRRSTESSVVMDVGDIVDATGVSRRYAYDLVDDLPAEYGWLHDRSDLTQYGDLEIDKDSQAAALVVDFDGVHGPKCPVNKFTTGGD